MFDPQTEALIARAHPLEGLDTDLLARSLTDAYVRISSVRSTAARGFSEGLRDELDVLGRLASTYEAIVALDQNRENRQSTAFVAGTAKSLLASAARLLNSGDTSEFSAHSIPEVVSAALLFLIADATADSAEAAKGIQRDVVPNSDIESALAAAIVGLAEGNLARFYEAPLPPLRAVSDGPSLEEVYLLACDALYRDCLHALQLMARRFLGAEDQGGVAPEDLLAAVIRDAAPSSVGDVESLSGVAFAGPGLLARLLLSLGSELDKLAAVHIEPPPGIDASAWYEAMRAFAARKTFVWKNHLGAIESGYLDRGVSAAVSFPTGAGKSVLAELKVLATTIAGGRVIVLAPTLSLVDQIARSYEELLGVARVAQETTTDFMDPFSSFADPLGLDPADVLVMTPERCLALLGFSPETLRGVGLIVFDECHLLHAASLDESQRAMDAMLALLQLSEQSPEADLLLLSAMMSNAAEVAGWLAELTSRPALALVDTWKPTRQARAAVVYRKSDVDRLQEVLRDASSEGTSRSVPARVQRAIQAVPFGLFGLKQNWNSLSAEDYRLAALHSDFVTLATAGDRPDWYLTGNANQVGRALAERLGIRGVKTLVFAQTIKATNASARELAAVTEGVPEVRLNAQERRWLRRARAALGTDSATYFTGPEEEPRPLLALPHNSLLLDDERRLHEALFLRPDGVRVMVATSTLAQGMNLPTEAVVIAGDSRFDPGLERLQQLEAHELLNAAGRAGRAGQSANAIVLVVPNRVVTYDDEADQVNHAWTQLRDVFAKSDQCVDIVDATTHVLDAISEGTDSAEVQYFLRRLPLGDEVGEGANAGRLMQRSFAGYFARARSRGDEFNMAVANAVAARESAAEAAGPVWARKLASTTGVEPRLLELIGDALGEARSELSVSAWADWLIDVVASEPATLARYFRLQTRTAVLGGAHGRLPSLTKQGAEVLVVLRRAFPLWVGGKPLTEIENALNPRPSSHLEIARAFVLRWVPEIAFLAGLPSLVQAALDPDDRASDSALLLLPLCARAGVPSAEALERLESEDLVRTQVVE